jgi:hypothetical protein
MRRVKLDSAQILDGGGTNIGRTCLFLKIEDNLFVDRSIITLSGEFARFT